MLELILWLLILFCSMASLALFIAIYGTQVKLVRKLDWFIHHTDYDFRAIKTRLADEERDDQRAKRKEANG